MMAGTEFVYPLDQAIGFFASILSDGTTLAIDINKTNGDIVYATNEDDLSFFESINQVQFFLKHSSFAIDSFESYLIENIHSGKIYFINQRGGDGHITINFIRIPCSPERPVIIDVSYSSFFIDRRGFHFKPPDSLVAYYKAMTKRLKRDTKRFEVLPGRNVWLLPKFEGDLDSVKRCVLAAFKRGQSH